MTNISRPYTGSILSISNRRPLEDKRRTTLEEEVNDFLGNPNGAEKALRNLGPGPFYYLHDGDILLEILQNNKNLCTEFGLPSQAKHMMYFVPSAIFNLNQKIFTMEILEIFVPVLTYNEDGSFSEFSTTAHHECHHKWEGPGLDKTLFNSLKQLANEYNPKDKWIKLDTKEGPILFYKATQNRITDQENLKKYIIERL